MSSESLHTPPFAYRLGRAVLHVLPVGVGLHPIAANLLRRFPVPHRTLATGRMRGGVDLCFDLGIPQEAAAWMLGVHEPGTVAFLSSCIRHGGVFFDVGANIGLTALPVVMTCPHAEIYCFEADSANADRLRWNVQNLRHASVHVEEVAVSDSSGYVPFEVGNGMLSKVTADSSNLVPSTSLDDYVAEHGIQRVDLIKVDVEGHELNVLHGAEELIQRDKPTIVCEAAGHGDDDSVRNFLLSRDYDEIPIPLVGLQVLRRRLLERTSPDRNRAFVPRHRRSVPAQRSRCEPATLTPLSHSDHDLPV